MLAVLAALALAALASVAFGTRVVGWGDVVSALTGNGDDIAQIAVRERVPRTLLALMVGAALAVSGAVLQGVTRNPLADPGIMGVNAGAAAAVVLAITFLGVGGVSTYIWFAFAGAGLATILVYAVGSLGRDGATPVKLALAGAVTWAAISSLTSAILLPRIDVMDRFRFWQIGGVGGADWERITQVLPFLVVGAVICLGVARGLNSLGLGDDVAAGLGEHIARTRLIAAFAAVTLCGAATAVAGPIAFVGLVVPHLCRLLIGLDHRWLLPFAALAGATLLTIADVVGRIVARPAEVDVGIVTAFIGAPLFIWVVRRQKARPL
jgi:iron complex transport system permease protein